MAKIRCGNNDRCNVEFKWNLKNVDFEMCGLDASKNFLKAPECPCGCGGTAVIFAESVDDMLDNCESMLADTDFDEAAIILFISNNTPYLITKCEGNIDVFINKNLDDYANIGTVLEEIGFEKIGIIVAVDDDKYEIVED